MVALPVDTGKSDREENHGNHGNRVPQTETQKIPQVEGTREHDTRKGP